MRRKLVAATRERILRSIIMIRGQKVILDRDIAELYEVPTKALIQAVKRNAGRFPTDFMFRLSTREFKNLRSQIVTSSLWGGRRTAPYAFTEQGVAMLSSVLRSRHAIDSDGTIGPGDPLTVSYDIAYDRGIHHENHYCQ
jgi:hypothetical protein